MRKVRAISFVAAALAAICLIPSISASAATEADVINAVRAAGWPDWMVQTVANSIAGGSFSSEEYDAMISQVTEFDKDMEKQLAEQLGITLPEEGASSGTPENSGGSAQGNTQTGNSSGSSSSDRAFINMTLEEKEAYISSMTEAEKQAFMASLSDEERKSIIKQMGLSDKAELVAGFTDMLSEFGITVNIDELTADNISISTLDEDGNLLGVSSMTMTIDPTGRSYTVPVVTAAGLILLSAAGMTAVLRRKDEKKETL